MMGMAETSVGRPVTIFLTLMGRVPDSAETCTVKAGFAVVGPRGVAAVQRMAVPVRVGLKPARGAGLLPSTTGFGLTVSDRNVAGTDHVRATITDHVARISVRTEQALTLPAR